jgi:hypothetical protein
MAPGFIHKHIIAITTLFALLLFTSLYAANDISKSIVEGGESGDVLVGMEEEEVSTSLRRRLLGWKKKQMCPPGLDICREEEKRKAEEIAEKKRLREEAEAAEAAALEAAAEQVKDLMCLGTKYGFCKCKCKYFLWLQL